VGDFAGYPHLRAGGQTPESSDRHDRQEVARRARASTWTSSTTRRALSEDQEDALASSSRCSRSCSRPLTSSASRAAQRRDSKMMARAIRDDEEDAILPTLRGPVVREPATRCCRSRSPPRPRRHGGGAALITTRSSARERHVHTALGGADLENWTRPSGTPSTTSNGWRAATSPLGHPELANPAGQRPCETRGERPMARTITVARPRWARQRERRREKSWSACWASRPGEAAGRRADRLPGDGSRPYFPKRSARLRQSSRRRCRPKALEPLLRRATEPDRRDVGFCEKAGEVLIPVLTDTGGSSAAPSGRSTCPARRKPDGFAQGLRALLLRPR